VVKYVNQTIVRYINQTVPVYINRTVYVSVNPFHVNYTCQLYVYVIQHNMTVIAYGYTNANLTMYQYLAALFTTNISITAPSVYVSAYYNGTYTIFYTLPGVPNRLNALPPIKPNPAWNGTWILAGAPFNMPLPPESDFVNAFPCNVTVYVEK
jgi:hypothetical protein